MKQYTPYIIAFAIAVLLVVLVLQGGKSRHSFNNRITLSRLDKIPYGTYVAFNALNDLFPAASVSVNKKEPGFWDSLSTYADRQALIIISPKLLADEREMNEMIRFVKKGNTVFISTTELSYDAEDILKCEMPTTQKLMEQQNWGSNDSFKVTLMKPPFQDGRDYICPGLRYETYFSKHDGAISNVLGNGMNLMPDFLHFKAGEGNLYVHSTPLAFSNYFLLHKRNMNYYNQIMSVIPKDTRAIVWDEYYMRKRQLYKTPNDDESDPANSHGEGALSALMKSKPFASAFILLLILLILYALQELRRKQRYIPELAKPRNDSMDFVKTIGRLYYEKGDHLNLARKMAAYFREHVRNRYKLSTSIMDDKFVKTLHMKSGYDEEGLNKMISFMALLDTRDSMGAQELAGFHNQLEDFYKLG